jgi:hypothetical protein
LCRRDRIDNSKPKNMIYVFSIREGVKDWNLLRYDSNRHNPFIG